MNTDLFDHDHLHHWGDSTTHPMDLPWSALAALFLLAGSSQLHRCTLPVLPMTALSDVSNCQL